MTIGKRIADLRRKKKMSQSELARALHVSPSTIGMWETDQRAIKDDFIKRIATYFNVSSDYLLGNSQNKTSDSKVPTDLKDALDVVFSYDGKPLTDEDKEFLKAFLEGRKSKD